jgi:hypothetical protein
MHWRSCALSALRCKGKTIGENSARTDPGVARSGAAEAEVVEYLQ